MHLRSSISAILFFLVFLTVASSNALAADWKPVPPEHIGMKSPSVEPDADAEALFWEVTVNDEDLDTVLSHYIRIKIFTERGKESEGKVEIPYLGSTRIRDIAARTIKPDGTVIEMKKDAVFERTLLRASGFKVNAKSFALPGVEPGVIVEYRWREIRRSYAYMRFYLQRAIPVQTVKYYIKPYAFFQYGMRLAAFNGPSQLPIQKEKGGFYSVTVNNVTAYREEPRMPPEDQVRRWMLVYYSEGHKIEPQKFWKEHGKRVYDAYKPLMKVNDDVKRAAAEATGGASTPEEKLERIYNYCRTKVKNVYNEASGFTAEQREKMKENKQPSDTLKRGVGTTRDINMLFAAMATASGFDARLAQLGDRGDIFFDPNFPDDYFLNTANIAVRVGENWRFFDPGTSYIPFGMLRWQEEGVDALVSDPKDPVFVKTPLSPPDKSVQKRTAKLKLLEDGTLEGEVQIEYTGHLAAYHKANNDEDSADKREENLRDRIRSQMSTAELSEVRIENVTDQDKPFMCSFKVRIPGYALRTGKRLLFQPAFFQKGIGALFPTSQRRYAIYFQYPWMEDDTVIIELPEGYALDNADAPSPFNVDRHAHYDVKIGVFEGGRAIQYKRSFYFGGGNVLLFPTNSYSNLKKVFDELLERDNHTLAVRQTSVN